METETVKAFENGTMVALTKEFPHPKMTNINYPTGSWGMVHFTDKEGTVNVYMNPVQGVDRNFVLIVVTPDFLRVLYS